MDEGEYTINFMCEQELGNALQKLRTTPYCIYNVPNIVVILTKRALSIKELAIHITVPLQLPQQAVLSSMSSVGFRPVPRCTNPLAKGQTQPPHCNGGVCMQLPLSTGDYAPSMAFPLCKSVARISHE